ncbi:DUF1016 N-terminal domain-containing protein [Chitinophaga arvensicola]|uniref:YhcG N-terminal domain-containing protein n=1 Tax=Chitinophaga arvensicola TaxID=29529 RepID=A0A1I0RTL2_9BACT|nr:DUF1016 N-terminal domain-containing protein [Chitinophaga arvensicola]SEW44544.1 Protein of unknown function [Chitinophaga arvensicola]
MQQEEIIGRLVEGVSGFIQRERPQLIRQENVNVLLFYWQIGTNLLQLQMDGKPLIPLHDTYGPLFQQEQLENMMRLATIVSDRREVSQLAAMVGWSHIVPLLSLEDREARFFYAWLAALHNHTVTEMEAKMATGLFEKVTLAKGAELKKLVGLSAEKFSVTTYQQLKSTGPLRMRIFMSGITGNLFRNGAYLHFLSTTGSVDKDIVVWQIDNFRSQQHSAMNAFVNGLFWRIGKEYREIFSDDDPSILQAVADELVARHGSNFTAEHLGHSISFARQLTDTNQASQLMHLVSWWHIIPLLSLDSFAEQLFYARLAAVKGLTAAQLRESIAANEFEYLPEDNEYGLSKAADLTPASVSRKGNSTMEIVYVGQDGIRYNASVNPIFKDPLFLSLI